VHLIILSAKILSDAKGPEHVEWVEYIFVANLFDICPSYWYILRDMKAERWFSIEEDGGVSVVLVEPPVKKVSGDLEEDTVKLDWTTRENLGRELYGLAQDGDVDGGIGLFFGFLDTLKEMADGALSHDDLIKITQAEMEDIATWADIGKGSVRDGLRFIEEDKVSRRIQEDNPSSVAYPFINVVFLNLSSISI
jgi:hypothetical protein